GAEPPPVVDRRADAHRTGEDPAAGVGRVAALARRHRARARRAGDHAAWRALAAEGANDGLWQWNLQTKEFYVSGRWRAMIGLPAHAAIGGFDEWLDR